MTVATATILERRDRPRALRRALLTTSVVLLTLFDLYFPQLGFPIVSVIGAVGLCASVVLYPRLSRPDRERTRVSQISLALSLALAWTAFLSWAWGNMYWGGAYIKAPIGIALGMLTFLATVAPEGSAEYSDSLYAAITLAMAIHAAFLCVQVAYFAATGGYLDFLGSLGAVPTRGSSNFLGSGAGFLNVLRMTGLFAEPAKYATFAFMGVAFRFVYNKFRAAALDWIVMATALVSLSIYGYFLLVILIVAYLAHARRRVRDSLVLMGIAVAALALFGLTEPAIFNAALVTRVLAPTSDPSGAGRLLSLSNYLSSASDEAQLFGIGLGNYETTFGYESNGIAFLAVSSGFVGALLIGAVFAGLLQSRRAPASVWIFVGASMLGAPLFTNPYWWLWVAALCLAAGRTRDSQWTDVPAEVG